MQNLLLREFHQWLHANFIEVRGMEVVGDYGDVIAEHRALRETVGVLDLGFRGRLCVLGTDRIEFIHGQVTNDVKALAVGQGCYAALVSARGKIQSDLNVYRLQDEVLLDFEPGLTAIVQERLEKYVIAADVQLVDVAPHYSLLSVQGPKSIEVVQRLELGCTVPTTPRSFATIVDPNLGQMYLMHQPRFNAVGFDLFVPNAAAAAIADKLVQAAKALGGRPCGWNALEIARIEAGVPRFGADMDETNLAPEAVSDSGAISYSKGCYIGQEVIARVRTYGQVAKSLRGLRLPDDLPALPAHGVKLFKDGKEVGYITSAVRSPILEANIALGYVRREASQDGNELLIGDGPGVARIVTLPFVG